MYSSVIHIPWSALSAAARLQWVLQVYHKDYKSLQDFYSHRECSDAGMYLAFVFLFPVLLSCENANIYEILTGTYYIWSNS